MSSDCSDTGEHLNLRLRRGRQFGWSSGTSGSQSLRERGGVGWGGAGGKHVESFGILKPLESKQRLKIQKEKDCERCLRGYGLGSF